MRGMDPIGMILGATLAGVIMLAIPSCAATPIAVSKVECPPLKTYAPADQAALGVELAKLPADSPLAAAMLDYQAMRDADRACMAQNTPSPKGAP